MYSEEDLLPLSALQHFIFRERQYALIHIEQLWDENLLTAEGRIMHERVHELGEESRGNVKIERGVPLRSLRLGLIGKADVVEFQQILPQLRPTRGRILGIEIREGEKGADVLCGEENLTKGGDRGARDSVL